MPKKLIIEDIRRRGGAAAIFIDGQAEIILDNEIIQKYSLRAGAEIDSIQLESIIRESDRKRAREYAMSLLAARAYSSGLLRNKMETKGFPSKTIKTIMDDLKDRGYLDDRKYARQAVESILRWKPAGRGYLISYLQARHISREMALTVVAECLKDVDEADLALRLLRPRRSYLAKFELETARTKAYTYLSRRAIGYQAAKQAFERLMREETQD
jgi:regulatory protein